jgi:hypothetical protein
MAVRIQNPGKRAFPPPERPIQIASEINARERLKMNPFDAVAIALDFPKDLSVQRGFLGKRPEPATDQDLLADFFGAKFPFLPRGNGWEIPRRVEISRRFGRAGAGGEQQARNERGRA